jgi:hypothetical protein
LNRLNAALRAAFFLLYNDRPDDGLYGRSKEMSYHDVLATFLGFRGLSVKEITDDRWGVEGLYSQQFSVGIFIFLFLCIVVFTVVVYKFMQSGSKTIEGGKPVKQLKTGEKIMFFWIYVGIIAAVIMAAMQLLQGYLF